METFEKWFAELKQVAVNEYGFSPEAAESMDAKAWRDGYFAEGMSPGEAMAEDVRAA